MEPMLISSINLNPSSQNPSLDDRHLLVVEKVADTLAVSSPGDQSMEDSSSEDMGYGQEADHDMIITHYQMNAKSEALARRAPSKRGTKPKKGRKSPLT